VTTISKYKVNDMNAGILGTGIHQQFPELTSGMLGKDHDKQKAPTAVLSLRLDVFI